MILYNMIWRFDLPDSLISGAEVSDSMSKFASLVGARVYFFPVTVPDEELSIWRVTSKLF